MKKYTINVHFDMVVTEEVTAENYESARTQAELQAQDKSLDKEAECYGVDSCLVEETELECEKFKPVKNWQDVEKLLQGKLKKYFRYDPVTNDSKTVSELKDALSVVGDSYYGTDMLMEAVLKDSRILQVRKILTKGYGTAYRDKRVNAFTAQLCESNRWSSEMELDTEEGIKAFYKEISKS